MNSLKLTSWPLILTAVLFIPARLVTAQRQWEFGHSSNYRHRDNWVSRRLPCPHDSASLPRAESPNLIGLSRPLLVQRKLLLPAEGETALILFDGAGLKAFDETSASGSAGSNSEDQKRCSSDDRIRDAAYNLTEPLDWFRPDNWARSQSQREFFDALPVDRLPGPCDSVRFKDDATYFVKMLGRGETVTVGQLEICGRTFTGGESNDDSSKRLQDFWRQSPLAKRQFLWSSGEDSDDPPFSLGLFGSGDSRDCEVPLPVQSASLMSRVCSGLVNAEAAPCSNPIPAAEVSGACTDLCGSVALLIRSETISLKKLLNQLLKALQDKPASLRLSAFRTSRIEPTYQLVLRIRRHASDGGGSADAGKLSVIKALRWLESNAAGMRFSIVRTLKSGDMAAYAARTGALSGGAAASLTASLIVIFMLLIVGAAVFAIVFIGRRRGWAIHCDIHPRRLWQQWLLWRHQTLEETTGVEFSTASGTVGFTSGSDSIWTSSSSSSQNQAVSVAMAFTNPIYDVSQPDTADVEAKDESTVADHEL